MGEWTKLLFFFLMFGAVVPAGMIALRAMPKLRVFAFIIMLYCISNLLIIHIDPVPDWTGTARGYPFTMVDFIMLMLLGSLIGLRGYRFVFFPPGVWFYFLYFLFGLISVYNAVFLDGWGFEVLKMVWMYLFFITCYNFIMFHRDLQPIIYTIGITLTVMFLVALKQKYFGSYYQIPSTFPHQNSMGMFCIMYTSIILSILFNERLGGWEYALVGFFLACGGGLMVFSLSRGGLMCLVIAVMIVLFLSVIYNGLNMKKLALIVVLAVAVLLPAVRTAPRIYHRFKSAPEISKVTRVNLALAAGRIANAHTLGVGLNNFSIYSGPFSGYAEEQYSDVRITLDTPETGAIVETIYLLVAAECGWLGLLALLGWFGYYLYLAASNVFFLRYRPCFGIASGILAGLIANYIQSVAEWSLKQYSNFYQLMFIFALTAALYSINRERRIQARREYEAKQRHFVEAAKPWRHSVHNER